MALEPVPEESVCTSSDLPQPQRSPLAQQCAQLLHKRLRIQVKDGRVLVGEFACLDRQGNIVLSNCHEELIIAGKVVEKMMGQIIVPAAHRHRCEVEALPGEADAVAALLAGGSDETAAPAGG